MCCLAISFSSSEWTKKEGIVTPRATPKGWEAMATVVAVYLPLPPYQFEATLAGEFNSMTKPIEDKN